MLKVIILYCIFALSCGYKSISITPGGLKGFYMLGICKYIKENYCLDDFIFYGSSAGSWNALYLSLPFDDSQYFDKIIKIKPNQLDNLYDLETQLKQILLQDEHIGKYTHKQTPDNKCNICYSVYKKYKFKKIVKNNFQNWEDLIECCIASSHLPYISNNNLFYAYQNERCVDGGLFRTNYPKEIIPTLRISPKMFNNKKFLARSKGTNLNIEKMIYQGYRDAMTNCDYLDKMLSHEP